MTENQKTRMALLFMSKGNVTNAELDMKDKKLRYVVTKEITADRLRGIYQKLEDGAIPYEANIKNIAKGIKQVTIHCDEKDIAYFTNLLSDEN